MNLFQLVTKQMRQRALSTWLTMFSVLLGVGLAIAILLLQRESQSLFGQTDFGYDVLVGVKGSPLQLTVNTVYHIDKSPGNVKYSVYEQLVRSPNFRPYVRTAVPQCVGDSYKGLRIIGTANSFFGYDETGTKEVAADRKFEYRPDKSTRIAQGRPMNEKKFEAIIGSDVQKLTGLKLGDVFQATHGMPQPNETPDIHAEKWTVVGVLEPTHTAIDKCLYIGLTSFYTIFEHAKGEIDRNSLRDKLTPTSAPAAPAAKADDDDSVQHYKLADDGTIQLDPDVIAAREVSAILVRSRGLSLVLIYNINLLPDVMAVSPANTMREFFNTFLDGFTKILLIVSVLVIIVAAVGIMTTIYNSVSARKREIAILRALGATRAKILTLICVEAGLIGLLGGVLGFVVGHGAGALGSEYLQRTMGEGINWLRVSPNEMWFLLCVVIFATLAGLVPALKAYRTSVAANLVSG